MQMDIRPIRTEADYVWALAEITRYFDNQPAPGTPEGDRFDVLADLVEAYENRHYPIEAPDPIEAVRFVMQQSGRTQSDLAALLGSRSRASETHNRKRPLTLEMIQKISREWHIPADILVAPYRLDAA